MLRYRTCLVIGLLALSVGLPAAGQSKKESRRPTTPLRLATRERSGISTSQRSRGLPRPRFPGSNLWSCGPVRRSIRINSPNPTASRSRNGWTGWRARNPVNDQIQGKLPFQFIRAYGLAVDSKGTIYAADQGVSAIFMFDLERGVKLIKNGTDASFGLINGLAIDDNDRLFVSDTKLNRVLVLNAKHQMQSTLGEGVLSDPGGLAIDTENRFLYVVDTGNDAVRVFDVDSFKLLRTLGTPSKKHASNDPGTFSLPTNVAVDGDGNIYITDTFNDRVEIFDADGTFISQFGKNGDGPGQFERPKGIAVDCDGHIWVVDNAQDRVKVFNQQGQLLIYFGMHGYYPGQFMGAYGITIDKDNRVIVSETFPGRVQIFHYTSDAEFEKEKAKRAEADKPKAAPPVKPAGGGPD